MYPKRPIFVVGCPRSGTTLLQQILSGHSCILGLPETHFFSITHPRNKVKRLFTWPALLANQALYYCLAEIDRKQLKGDYRTSYLASDYTTQFVRLMEDLCEEKRTSHWLEKTPRHLHFIDEISRRIPNALFIHIVREGAPTIASLHKATSESPNLWLKRRFTRFKGYSVEQCRDRWMNDLSITATYMQRENHAHITYEKLITETEVAARYLSEFIDLEFEPQMLSITEQDGIFNIEQEPWKSKNLNSEVVYPKSDFPPEVTVDGILELTYKTIADYVHSELAKVE